MTTQDKKHIEDRVLALLAEEVGVKAHIGKLTQLEELGLDSLDYLHLIVQLEIEFSVNLDKRHVVDLKTVGGLILLIEDAKPCV